MRAEYNDEPHPVNELIRHATRRFKAPFVESLRRAWEIVPSYPVNTSHPNTLAGPILVGLLIDGHAVSMTIENLASARYGEAALGAVVTLGTYAVIAKTLANSYRK